MDENKLAGKPVPKKVLFKPPTFIPPAPKIGKPVAKHEVQKIESTNSALQSAVSGNLKADESGVNELKNKTKEVKKAQKEKLPLFQSVFKQNNGDGDAVTNIKSDKIRSNEINKSNTVKPPKIAKKVLPTRSLTDNEYDEIFSAAISCTLNRDSTSISTNEVLIDLTSQNSTVYSPPPKFRDEELHVEDKENLARKNEKDEIEHSESLEKVADYVHKVDCVPLQFQNLKEKNIDAKDKSVEKLPIASEGSEPMEESSEGILSTSETDSSAVETDSSDVSKLKKKKKKRSNLSEDEKMSILLKMARPWGSHAVTSRRQYSDEPSKLIDSSSSKVLEPTNDKENSSDKLLVDLQQQILPKQKDISNEVLKKTSTKKTDLKKDKLPFSNKSCNQIEDVNSSPLKKLNQIKSPKLHTSITVDAVKKNLPTFGKKKLDVSHKERASSNELISRIKSKNTNSLVENEVRPMKKCKRIYDKQPCNEKVVQKMPKKDKLNIALSSEKGVQPAEKSEKNVLKKKGLRKVSKNSNSVESCHDDQVTDNSMCNNIQSLSPNSSVSSSRKRPWSIVKKRFYRPAPPKFKNHKECMLWLMKERDVGTWVLCCNQSCNTWRYLHNVKEPTDIPSNWYCFMNEDLNANKCNGGLDEEIPDFDPEDDFDILYNEFSAGSVVWARVTGFPWWPAMIDDDVDTESFYWLDSVNSKFPSYYNVTFFDDKVTRAWVEAINIRKFDRQFRYSSDFKTKIGGIEYSHRIDRAMLDAVVAQGMTFKERLKRYSFVVRYNGPIRRPAEVDENDRVIVKSSKKPAEKRRKTEFNDSNSYKKKTMNMKTSSDRQITSIANANVAADNKKDSIGNSENDFVNKIDDNSYDLNVIREVIESSVINDDAFEKTNTVAESCEYENGSTLFSEGAEDNQVSHTISDVDGGKNNTFSKNSCNSDDRTVSLFEDSICEGENETEEDSVVENSVPVSKSVVAQPDQPSLPVIDESNQGNISVTENSSVSKNDLVPRTDDAVFNPVTLPGSDATNVKDNSLPKNSCISDDSTVSLFEDSICECVNENSCLENSIEDKERDLDFENTAKNGKKGCSADDRTVAINNSEIIKNEIKEKSVGDDVVGNENDSASGISEESETILKFHNAVAGVVPADVNENDMNDVPVDVNKNNMNDFDEDFEEEMVLSLNAVENSLSTDSPKLFNSDEIPSNVPNESDAVVPHSEELVASSPLDLSEE